MEDNHKNANTNKVSKNNGGQMAWIVNDENDRAILDAYYANGFNRMLAVESVRGMQGSNSAKYAVFKSIQERQPEYIKKKRVRLKAMTDIHNEHVLRELINWAYVDVTRFISLTPNEIKELPEDIKRCIQSFKHTKRSYETRDGVGVTDEVIEIKLIDKTKAIEMINKHIGFYAVDNKQKAQTINLTKITTDKLNILNQLMIDQQANEPG